MVAYLTSLNDNLFSGTNVSDNSNIPCLCNKQRFFRASAEVNTRVLLIEVKKAPISLLLIDIKLERILEAGDLGLMVFTKAIFRELLSWKDQPKTGSGEYGVDLRSTGRRNVKGLIDNSN